MWTGVRRPPCLVADASQHLEHRLVGATVQRPVQGAHTYGPAYAFRNIFWSCLPYSSTEAWSFTPYNIYYTRGCEWHAAIMGIYMVIHSR